MSNKGRQSDQQTFRSVQEVIRTYFPEKSEREKSAEVDGLGITVTNQSFRRAKRRTAEASDSVQQ